MRVKNEKLRVTVTGYESGGMGVARYEGDVLFIRDAVRGDDLTAHVLKPGRVNYARVAELHTPGPGRCNEPGCPAARLCGGCDLRHMTAEEEAYFKRTKVDDALQRIGGLTLKTDEYLAGEQTLGYRNKAMFPLGKKDGKTVFGFFRRGSHDLVPLEDCPIQAPAGPRLAAAVCRWMDKFSVPVYEEASGKGLVRQVFVRTSTTGASLCTLICTRDDVPEVDALVQALRAACPDLVGLVLNVNDTRGNTLLGPTYRALWGEDALEDTLCSLRFRLSPAAFYQVNHDQAERLYEKAAEYAGLTGTETVLDLYCGTGTITLFLAKQCKQAIGVEVVPQAVENAKENARRNGIENAEFFAADAGETARELQRRGLRPDVVVVDPPRKGLSLTAIDAIRELQPEKVVYVSCDPATLARDLKLFRERGYEPRRAAAVDLFPRTKHVETVCLLCRKTDFN